MSSLLLVALAWPLTLTPRAQQAPAAPSAAASVPKDLKPLLLPRQSEMRIPVQWYTADRQTLSQNYMPAAAGGGRGGGRGGRGGAQPPAAPETPAVTAPSVSRNRIARLKRLDMDWQLALSRLDASTMSAAAQADLAELKKSIAANLAELDTDARALAALTPLLPFAADLVELYEARVRVEPMQAQEAAGRITAAHKSIAATRAKMESGAVRIAPALAGQTAAALDAIRFAMNDWYTFYNGYDPLFTWWMNLPYGHLTRELEAYTTLLRSTVIPANQTNAGHTPVDATIEPVAPPRRPSVPDLQYLMALPQDETIQIVNTFRGAGAAGGRGRGGAPQQERDVAFHEAWLAALKTLDFNTLSRNAQVNYLAIKRICEQQIARARFVPPANIPRKTDTSGIEGAARGRDGLILDLADEMIPYSPEELIELGNREFAWTVAEMEKASIELGFGTNWMQALEHTKNTAVPPGEQPQMIQGLVHDAADFLIYNDLITITPVNREALRMGMMSPERQLVNPFFTGGAIISVSYPTDTMEYDQRIQSMRGNNPGFSNATAGHEMIPGHNYTAYMGQRLNGHRANLGISTPFYGEGWALYWETMFWDLGFHDTPHKKIGALFWRMHRAARIVFSLKFHMGQWSPQECVDFLVNEVGHERENAIAEVRRSFQGNYGPLYQAAYLLGGLQLRGLKKELVDSGQMTLKQFHDAVVLQGSMPFPLTRMAISTMPLSRDTNLDWKFYGDIQVGK
ncbi:MAG: hypothetical protein AMXMBFR57_04270 [Acidimicrobiia bacterium]